VATGSTKGAAAIRYRRLKERIERETGAGGANTANGTGATQKSSAKGKKSSGSRKRKAPVEDEDDNEDEDKEALPQVDGAADGAGTKRQTRGKKLDYDILASFTSDDDRSLMSLGEGDEDYVVSQAIITSEDEVDMFIGFQHDVKPNMKHRKKSQQSSLASQTTSTPATITKELSEAPVTPPSTVFKHGSKLTEAYVAPGKEKEIPLTTPGATKGKVKSTMHYSQKPLPSIEYSPPLTPTRAIHAKKRQTDVEEDSDIDIKSLKPGTVLNFPAKSQPQINTVLQKPIIDSERLSSPITITSSLSSSHDSAGRMLKQTLADHVEPIKLRPEDSISNIGVPQVEDVLGTPATPAGKQPFFRYL
jgi:hypothetical protein